MHERLFIQLWYGTAPLIVWAAHFSICYLLVAAECSPALITPAAPSGWLLGIVSALAFGACLWMLWRAKRTLGPEARLLDWARTGNAALALAGVAWTSLPLLLLDGCG